MKTLKVRKVLETLQKYQPCRINVIAKIAGVRAAEVMTAFSLIDSAGDCLVGTFGKYQGHTLYYLFKDGIK